MVDSSVKWSPVAISEVIPNNYRLEANYFGFEGRESRKVLKNKCKWPIVTLCGENGLATAYHRPRFKRIFVKKSNLPIFQPAQINDINPEPYSFISGKTDTSINNLRVRKNQILLTCSGTIGNCTIVNNTLENKIFSHDLIRLTANNLSDVGYLYVFLKSKLGKSLITSNKYGSVIDHIEPEHLDHVSIPDPSQDIKDRINDLITQSFQLRDDSNQLMNESRSLLKSALNFPEIEYFENHSEINNFSMPLSKLNCRLDASYHLPIVDNIEKHLIDNSKEVKKIGDENISSSIICPDRFKRIFVKEGFGAIFIGGKQIYELDPSNKKYLSLVHHEKLIREQLLLHQNMILITCSGTIGKVNIVPKHWENWTANQHIIRIIPKTRDIAGYLYTWLSTEYAYPLITRFTYGAVIDEIDGSHVAQISVPLLKSETTQNIINSKTLEANDKRSKANELEQTALKIFNDEVIFSK